MYEIYQLDSTGAELIGVTSSLNQACSAAWSRASLMKITTQVVDQESGTVQELYLMAPAPWAADVYQAHDY